MQNQDLNISFLVSQSPKEVFDAVTNVRGWWTENVKGDTASLNDIFSVKFWDVHYSEQKLVEVIPESKVVWLITDSYLSFLKDKHEWTGSKIVFEITSEGSLTRMRFMHEGLAPGVECYTDCSNAWKSYIGHSLLSLIMTGNGQPEKSEEASKLVTK